MSTPAKPSDYIKKKHSDALKAFRKNHLIEAETLFAECLASDETFHPAWLHLGLVWTKMGRTQDAIDAFRMAAALNDQDVDSLYNLGLALSKSGHENEGLTYLSKASDLSKDPKLAISIGDVYYKLLDYKVSSLFYLKAYKKEQYNSDLTKKLAISLYQEGDTARATKLTKELLLKSPNNEDYIALYSEMMNKYAENEFCPDTKKALELCLRKDTIRHRNIAPAWGCTFLTDPYFEPLRSFHTYDWNTINLTSLAKLLGDDFLCYGLKRNITSNALTEHIFTNIRRYFTFNWDKQDSWPIEILKFLSSLAIQCWYNDFIYFETAEEKDKLQSLITHIRSEANKQEKIDVSLAKHIALACCYLPLYEVLPNHTAFHFTSACQTIVEPLLKAQFKNPQVEMALIPQIKSFTNIEDATSLAVQKMYESRPYPRWTNTNNAKNSNSLQSISNNLEILVAGCGTGQEPALYAATLPSAKITAIDLSRTSIAYGMRMAKELGYIDRITFLHGDLMKVGELNKKFDYVVSSGVLHHLKEPEKGLAAILSTLKPGGKMSISLYSKHARDIILNPATDYIKEKGYSSSLDDVRQFRQDILKLPSDDPRALCTKAGDFFNLCECNDLLFHVQEHRYTFPLIKDMAERHGLAPYWVSLAPKTKKLFFEMFQDGQLSDLDLMDKFELKYPESFAEMYKVYFQRKDEISDHPLDILIKIGAI